jgi:Mrp family chromosome partitioning ATPase
MQTLLRGVKDKFDFIVIDSPPVIPFSEARLLSLVCDVVVLVGRYGFTTQRAITRGMQLLEEVRAPVAGVVLNDMDLSSADYHYYNYGFGRGMGDKYYDYPPRPRNNKALPPSAVGGGRPNSGHAGSSGPDSDPKSRGAHA